MSQRSERTQPPAGLDIVSRQIGGTLVVAIGGEVDLDTAPELHAAVTAAVGRTAGDPCVVDLTAVTFLGSAGLTALLDAARLSTARGGALRIVVDSNRPVIRPMVVTGLDQVFTLYHSVDEALAATTNEG